MKKLFSIFFAVCFSLSALATATVFEFNSDGCLSQTADGFSVAIAQAGGTVTPQFYNNEARLYAKNTLTVSGTGITRIELTFTKQGSKAYADLTESTGKLTTGGTSTSTTDKKTDVWTGSASSVTFTLGESGQRVIRRIVINRADGEELPGDEGETPVDPTQPEDTLKQDYVYVEPTEVIVSGQTAGNNMAYSFIKNNIKVECTKGAIQEDPKVYFGCNAGEELTFTATKNIKGLAINGFVKKDFEATVNHGDVTFMSPDDSNGAEGDPVLAISDIDAKSVTISCVKQLRCYSVKFYFESNPTDSVAGGGGGQGETFFLTFNSADAVYESLYSFDGEYNYTVYLYTDTIEYPYIGLDLYTATEGALEGVHVLEEYSFYAFGEGDDDYASTTEGQVAITKEGDIYTISGYMTCDDKNTYNFSFTGTMPFFTDDEYYGDEQGTENIGDERNSEWTKVLRNGQLLIMHGDKEYNVLGF